MIARRALLAAPALLLAGTAHAAVPLAARPIARLETAWWRARHQAKLAEIARARPDLIWLGDSITQNFERDLPFEWGHFNPVWQRYYAPRRAINLGFMGDATCHLLWRLMNGEIDGIAPKVAVILIGANSLGRLHWSAEDTVAGIEAVVAETKRRLPHTNLLLLSVLPSDRTTWASQTTVSINADLAKRFRAVDRVTYHDVTSLFMRNAAFDRSLFYDPLLTPPEPALHPTADGMARLAAAIEPDITRLIRA